MIVFENERLIIEYDEEREYFKVARLGKDDISEDEYKMLMLRWAKEITFYKPKIQLVNYLNQFRPVPDHLKLWINENLMGPAFKLGMRKVAFIISRDYFVQVSLEQTMQEKVGKKFKLKYFDNVADAEKWLFEKEL